MNKRDDISVDDVLREFVTNENSSSEDDDTYDEVMQYMKMKVNYQNGEDILAWWKKHSTIFPQLSHLALALVSIPHRQPRVKGYLPIQDEFSKHEDNN